MAISWKINGAVNGIVFFVGYQLPLLYVDSYLLSQKGGRHMWILDMWIFLVILPHVDFRRVENRSLTILMLTILSVTILFLTILTVTKKKHHNHHKLTVNTARAKNSVKEIRFF